MNKIDRYKILILHLISQNIVKNQKDFGQKLGYLNESYFSQIINCKVSEPSDFSRKIKSLFPKLNVSWLEEGKGDMIENTGQKQMAAKCSLPLIPVDAVAGFHPGGDDGAALAGCPLYSVPDFAVAGADFLIRVSGDSMAPRLSQGDILACRRLGSPSWIQWGKVYVLDTEQGALVKRLFPAEDDDKVRCHSDNSSAYPDFEMPKSGIRSMSVVVGMISSC